MKLFSMAFIFLISNSLYSAEMVKIDSSCGSVKLCSYTSSDSKKVYCATLPNGKCPNLSSCEGNQALRLSSEESKQNKVFSMQEHFDLLGVLKKFSTSKGDLNSLDEINKLRLYLGNDKYAFLKKYFEKGGKLNEGELRSIDQTADIMSKLNNKDKLNLKETKFITTQLQKNLPNISKDEPIYKSINEFLTLPIVKQKEALNAHVNARLPATAAMVVAVATVHVVETLVKQASGGGDRFSGNINIEISDKDFDLP